MKIIPVLLALMLLVSCGEAVQESNTTIPEVKTEYSADDFSQYLPENFKAYEWKEVEGNSVFAIAEDTANSNLKILLIKTENFVKVSESFEAEKIEFGTNKSWGVRLEKESDTLGYAISIDMGTGDVPGYFVKVFRSSDFAEIPNSLGAGFVARDFYDLDGSGDANLLFLDNRWTAAPSELVALPLFTHVVCGYKNGVFSDATPNHPNQMAPGLSQFKEGLQVATDEREILNCAINLMLTMYVMGDKEEAITGFSKTPDQLINTDRIKFAEEISEHVKLCFENNLPLTPPWFAPTPEPAWTPLEFETIEVKQ